MNILRLLSTTLLSAAILIAGHAHGQDAAKPSVTGKFLGNGKPAALAFVSAHEREPFSDKEAIALVFTEKDHSASKKPDFDASFGKFGSSLTISIHLDGSIFGCQVAHTGLKKPSFSTVGILKMSDFKIADGMITGSLSTGGPDEFFGDKWDVDLKFAVPVPAKGRGTAATPPKTAKTPPADAPAAAPPAPPKPAGPRIAARSLPLPKSAADVEYKQLVGHITFTSPQSVEAVAKEFTAALKKQGWQDGSGTLIGKRGAIIERKRGEAKLNIMIQPAASGSSTQIFTEGLDWDAAAEGSTPPKPKPAAKDDPDDLDTDAIEAEAKKLLEKALKKLPK